MHWTPEHWIGDTYYPPREATVDTEEKLKYLIEKIHVMNNAVNNEAPDLAILELDRMLQQITEWENSK